MNCFIDRISCLVIFISLLPLTLMFCRVFFIQVRVAFEEFSGHATQMLTRLEEMQETVSRKDFPQDLEGARRMIEEHATLKKKVIKAPIEELDTEGQR